MWKRLASAAAFLVVFGVAVAVSGCEKTGERFFVPNLRPQVELSAAPQALDSVFYAVRLQWFGFDQDGQVTHFRYAVDPFPDRDTTWIRIEKSEITLFFKSESPRQPLPEAGPVASSDFHVFVIKAVDNEGMESPPVFRAFTSYTVAPQSQILSPTPSRLLNAVTAPSVLITWTGKDDDGVISQKLIKYKFKLVSIATIQQALDLGSNAPSPGQLQTFFGQEAPSFASWDSVPPDSTFKQFEGLTPGQRWYFAVVAFDEAGAYEPRFLLDNNLLQFRPSTTLQSPLITVFNSFFSRTQLVGGSTTDERFVVRIEVPADQAIPFNWFAEPGAQGTLIQGYRWVLNPKDGDIFDETPRRNDEETFRWSSWSLSELSAVVGPFAAEPGQQVLHRFYVQARDNVGSVSMMIIELRVVKPSFERELLVFDDLRGPPDRIVNRDDIDDPRNFQPFGSFPTEAILDTLLHAVGDVPYRRRPEGTMSRPGVFAGFDYDTLDYRFFPFEGLTLRLMSDYRAVVWFISAADAANKDSKFSFSNPMSALRFANTVGNLNTLAVYLSQGGKAWLFGDGVATAIANGYVSRFRTPLPARLPFVGTGDKPSTTSILWPGNFLYDFLFVRSEIDMNTRLPLSAGRELVDAIPYLPAFRTPGAPWPPDGWTGGRGAADDPRVGPSSARNLETPPKRPAGWDGLPQLTITTEFSDWPSPLPRSLGTILYVSQPNFILEDVDPDPARVKMEARLDTLYLMRAKVYNLSKASFEADGKPVFFYYWGDEFEPRMRVAWTTLPLWMFERTQLQTLAEKVLANFDVHKEPDPRAWTGPGSAHSRLPRVVDEVP